METFWKEALKVGGFVAIVMFVILGIFKDIIAKFVPIPPEYTLILAGLIITMLFLLASKAMDKNNKDSNNGKKGGGNGVSVGGNVDKSSIVTGNGNTINTHWEK